MLTASQETTASLMQTQHIAQSLLDLPIGTRCRVEEIGGSGLMRRRLMDLGMMPDAEITLVRVAPLNDPIEIRVGNAFVSLRRAEAVLIKVVALENG